MDYEEYQDLSAFKKLKIHLTKVPIHLAYGEHSDIPKCCILWFALVWNTLWIYKELSRNRKWPGITSRYHDWIQSVEYELAPQLKKKKKGSFRTPYQYIPCPCCLLTKRVVKIKECDIEGCTCEWPEKLKLF